MSLVPTQQRMENNLNSHLLFQNNTTPLSFARGSSTPCAKPGFMNDKLFSINQSEGGYFTPDLRRGGDSVGGLDDGSASPKPGGSRNWNDCRPHSTPSSGEEDEDDDEDDDDEGDKVGGISKDHALLGSSTRQMVIKGGVIFQSMGDPNRVSVSENDRQGKGGNFEKMVTVAERDGDMYYMPLLQGTEGSSQSQKDFSGFDSCGFNGRKNNSISSEPGESLRAIFSDPITGALMDDAMILPCGHSFGGGGIQQVIKMKACYTCSHPINEDSVSPNLSLRIAVQAFRREEDLMYKASKRKRERFEQDKGIYGDTYFSESPRGRGVHFPFAVTDRVIIKGNKRTPERFVGREAIVTTQCLNGWYVVKTLDNAESVKLQYRSLEKVTGNSSSKPMSDKITPNWL